MKKTISLILVFLLTFSFCSVFAFAEEPESKTAGEETVQYIHSVKVRVSGKTVKISGNPHCHIVSQDNSKIVGAVVLNTVLKPDNGYKFADNLNVEIANGTGGYFSYNAGSCSLYGIHFNTRITQFFYKFFPTVEFLIGLNFLFYGFDAAFLSELAVLFSPGILD